MQIRYIVDPLTLGDITPDDPAVQRYCDAVFAALEGDYPDATITVRPPTGYETSGLWLADCLTDHDQIKDVIVGVFSTPHLWAYDPYKSE